MPMKKHLFNAMRDKRGFSLGEMLATVMILVLAAGMLAAGVPLAANAYRSVVETANAQVLLSTTMTALRTELGSAQTIEPQAEGELGKITYYSIDTMTTQIANYKESGDVGEAGIWFTPYITVNSNQPDYSHRRLLISAAAADGLYATYDSITYNEATKLFTIENLRVMKPGSEEPLAKTGTFTVRAVNAAESE